MHEIRATLLLFAIAVAAACSSSSETITGPSQLRCSVDARAEAVTFTPDGGTGTVRVATARECSWSARSEAGWLVLTSPVVNGQGDGSFDFRVSANDDPGTRAAAIGVQEQRVQVSQAGRPCTYRLSSTEEVIDAAGGDRTVQLAASSAQCRWTVVTDAAWVAVASPREGSGTSAIVLRVEPLTGSTRTATVTIAGQALRVRQGQGLGPGPGPGEPCTYTVVPAVFNAPATGGTNAFAVRTADSCVWTSSSALDWAAISVGLSGSGPGDVRVAVAANTGPARTGTLTIAGQTITITQPSGCGIAVTPSAVSVAAESGSGTVQVTTGSACAWTASTSTPWIGIAEGTTSGTGNGQVRFSIAPNTGPARTGSVSIGAQIVSVSQASGCSYAISPSSYDAAAAGGGAVVSITTGAGCPWTASSAVEWMSLTTASGTGPAQVPFSVASNAGPPRSGALTVAGRAFTVRQASPCTWSFVPPFHLFDANGGNGAILVLVTGQCAWTAVSSVDWIRVTSGSPNSGSGLLQFAVAPNGGAARTAILIIGAERYEVTQTAR